MNINITLDVPNEEAAKFFVGLGQLLADQKGQIKFPDIPIVDIPTANYPCADAALAPVADNEAKEKPKRRKRRTKSELKSDDPVMDAVINEFSFPQCVSKVIDSERDTKISPPAMTYDQLSKFIHKGYVCMAPEGKSRRTKQVKAFLSNLYDKEIMLTEVRQEDYVKVKAAVQTLIEDERINTATSDDEI